MRSRKTEQDLMKNWTQKPEEGEGSETRTPGQSVLLCAGPGHSLTRDRFPTQGPKAARLPCQPLPQIPAQHLACSGLVY